MNRKHIYGILVHNTNIHETLTLCGPSIISEQNRAYICYQASSGKSDDDTVSHTLIIITYIPPKWHYYIKSLRFAPFAFGGEAKPHE